MKTLTENRDFERLKDAVRAASGRFGMELSRPLVMVSGGVDSVALLRVLLALDSEVRVLHLDHGLRGCESDADAEFVAKLCRELIVPCEVVRLTLAPGSGLQEAARNERYRVAAELAEKHGATCIATGHNADDVAETLLMNLARGAGGRGAGAIPPVSRVGDHVISRPLISSPRSVIEAALKDIGQTYRTDSTNLTGKYTRNRIRLEVLPVLDELYPGAATSLTRAAELLREDSRTLEELAAEALRSEGAEVVLRPEDLIHPGLLGHALRSAYLRVSPGSMPLPGVQVEKISSLIEKRDGTRVLNLPDGVVCAVRFGDEISFRRERSAEKPSGGADEIEIPASGEVRFGRWRIKSEMVTWLDSDDATRPEVCYLDAGGGPYRVRRVAAGDTVQPLGLGGIKKVMKAMADRKVPKDVRAETPVVVGGSSGVAWVFFGETGEEFAVRDETKAIIRLEISGGREF